MDDMEDCIEIDSYLFNKEELSISTSTLTETTIEEFLDKDEQIEKESTPNHMVSDLSNPGKLVMSLNSIIDNSSCNQITELNHINSWTLCFDISRNKHGTYAGCLLIHPCGKRTYSVIQIGTWIHRHCS